MHIFVPKLVPKPNYNLLLLMSPPTRIITYGQIKAIQYCNLRPWTRGKKGEANKENVSY